MTEYQAATLAIQQAVLWVAWGQLVVGLGKVAVPSYGIRTMVKTGEKRARDVDDEHDRIIEDLRKRGEADARTHRGLCKPRSAGTGRPWRICMS